MSITTYAELKTAIANWLKRSDLTNVIPDFITLAESQIARDLLDKRKFKYVPSDMEFTANGTTSGATIALPSGHKGTQYFKATIGSVDYTLEYMPPDQVSRFSGDTSYPKGYTIDGTNLVIVPTPDGGYDYVWKYIKTFDRLSGSNTTNWFLTANPDLYLYATLSESAPYLNNDARLATWKSIYATKLADYAAAVLAERQPDGPLRMRSNRVA